MQLSFRSKLMLTYSVFIIILIFAVGIGFYLNNASVFQKSAENNLNELALKTSQQLDSCIEEMDRASTEIISDDDFISAVRNISLFMTRSSDDNRTIMNSIVSKSAYKRNVYRASIFNMNGDFFSSKNYNEIKMNMTDIIYGITWLDKAEAKNGCFSLVPPHKDIWVADSEKEVFSLVRIIKDPGTQIGFIEIQCLTDKLKQICDIKLENDLKVIVLSRDGSVFYSKVDIRQDEINFYQNSMKGTDKGSISLESPVTGHPEIISIKRSEYSGLGVFLIQSKKDLLSALISVLNIYVIAGIGIILVTLLFFYIFACQLTLPLKKLTSAMEQMNIQNLSQEIDVKYENNEIRYLSNSFLRMRERLNEAIAQEINLKSMQYKAHFDALQAQINPHFIFNMLGVLSNIGEESDNTQVINISQNLAMMIRYSTSTSITKSTIREELDHTSRYLSLMKIRYEHRLEYFLEIDESIMHILVPKLILQPIVENSIYHGFDKSLSNMKIIIKGGRINNEWYISISDNGTGFKPEILESLNIKLQQYSQGLLSNENTGELSIGGMGLLNTFARLLLFFKNEVAFEFGNNEDNGAYITIKGKFDTKERGEYFGVQDNDS